MQHPDFFLLEVHPSGQKIGRHGAVDLVRSGDEVRMRRTTPLCWPTRPTNDISADAGQALEVVPAAGAPSIATNTAACSDDQEVVTARLDMFDASCGPPVPRWICHLTRKGWQANCARQPDVCIAGRRCARHPKIQPQSFGIRTLLITWMTPLLAFTSAMVTRALLIMTPCRASTCNLPPCTVLTVVRLPALSADLILPGTT